MRVLSYRDLPLVEAKYEKEIDWYGLVQELIDWADGNMDRFSMGFLLVGGDERNTDNYLLQIARVDGEAIVTDKELLNRAAELLWGVMELPEDLMRQARFHIEQYYKKLKEYTPWGEQEFYHLRDTKGMTERVLHGPHRGTGLKPWEKRVVIKKEDGNLAIGHFVS